MLWGQHLQTSDTFVLETIGMFWGDSQPLRKTFVSVVAHMGDDTMVPGPTERTAAEFSEGEKNKLNRGQNGIMRPEGPIL